MSNCVCWQCCICKCVYFPAPNGAYNLSAAKLQPNFIGIAGCFRDEQLPQILHYWSNFNLIRMESEKA